MKFSIKERMVRYGYFTAFILLILSHCLVFFIIWQMGTHASSVERANKTVLELEQLFSNMKDIESSIRGYMITQNDEYLEPFLSSSSKIEGLVQSMRSSVGNDELQQKRLSILNLIIKDKIKSINNSVKNIKENKNLNKNDTLQVFAEKKIMDKIRRIILIMQHQENKNLRAKTERFEQISTYFKIANIVTLFIAITLGFYSILIYDNENKAKKIYRAELEDGINKLKTANKELIELRSIEKFAISGRISRTIAHEVRNPLTNITLAADQLHDMITPTEDNSLMIEMITRNATRINDLVSELLHSTRFSELKLSPSSINEVLEKALDLANDRINLKEIHVHKKYSPNIARVDLDFEKMKIAFLNIIINAIEAMEPGNGLLEIGSFARNQKCLIYIKDNGLGMDKEELSRVFEPYFTSKENGNGLGLTNTQNIILNHKGNIHVESTLGKGTAFIISLNCASQTKEFALA